MKRAIAFLIVLLAGVAGLYFSQRQHDPTPVSANAIVAMAADAQRDLSRAPMRSRVFPMKKRSRSERNLPTDTPSLRN